MTIAEQKSATIGANGQTDWIPLGPNGSIVAVDFVDSDGDSASWAGASAALLWSPDGKMLTAARDANGDISGTDGFNRLIPIGGGYVAALVSSYSSGTCKINVFDL